MRIDALYNTIVDILRKQRNGSVSIADFNLRAYQSVLDAYQFYLKGYGVNQQTHDALAPFKVKDSFTSTLQGVVTFPSDYERLLSIKPDTSVYAVDFYNEDEIDLAASSAIRKVSSSYFIGELLNNSAQLYPKQIVTGTISYLRKPLQPIYNFTLSGTNNRTVTYNPTGSQDVEFGDLYLWKVIQGILMRCGVNLEDAIVMQYSQITGQENGK